MPSDFYRRVYALVRSVPPGKVTTFGIIAQALGTPHRARQVGWALHALNGSGDVPAHRVVNREGVLSGAWSFTHPLGQRGLLEAEGVRCEPDGRVDLDRYLYLPYESDAGE